MTTVEEADLFCEYYDFNELANLSSIGKNVEIVSIAPSSEPSNCAFTTTTAIEPAVPEPFSAVPRPFSAGPLTTIEPAVPEAFSVVPEPSPAVPEPFSAVPRPFSAGPLTTIEPAVPQAFPARSASPDVKEEPVDGFTGEISTDDKDQDEIEDSTDCVAQTDTEHPQPPFIPPEDIEDELLEDGRAENGFKLPNRTPRLHTCHETDRNRARGAGAGAGAPNELNTPAKSTKCQLVIVEAGYIRLADVEPTTINDENRATKCIEAVCVLCDFVCKNAQGLKTHMRYKHDTKQRPVACDRNFKVKCNGNTEREEPGPKRRMSSRRPTKTAKTPPAPAAATTNKKKKTNTSSSLLVNHRDQVLVYTCLTCSYRTGRKANLHAHFKRQHIFDVSVSIGYIISTYCDTSWAAKTDYVKILAQNAHGGGSGCGKNKKKARKKPQLHSCFACEYKSSSKHILERHLKERHAEYATETEPSAGRETAVARKEKIADGVERRKRKNGTISSAKTDQGAKWDSRTMSELREMRLVCVECDYSTKWRQNLVRHAKVRHGTYVGEFKKMSMYCCKICSFSCVNLWNIKQHIMDKHQGEDGERLAEDGKKMVGLGGVLKARNAKVVRDSSGKVAGKRKSDAIKDREPKKNHVKRRKLDSMDTQNKKIRCAKCAFFTTHVLSWKRHMVEVHGGRRSFICDACGHSFKRRETLNSHYLARHVKISGTYICSHCQFRNLKENKVRKHIMTKHKCCAKILRKK